ncbi:hypothetical protein GCM10008955_41140 [Deinococcus malanensis]|uniref:Uncharacterized protein n=1 Tax=Deinococcus malanensis TaxID=1706855 RepID=A0ABQ2F5X7_9DEIO|nr:hypothetical protein GCM10008955_41140 [Deinococcus malanensis]
MVLTDHGFVILVEHHDASHALHVTLHQVEPERSVTGACPAHLAHHLARLIEAGETGTLQDLLGNLKDVAFIQSADRHLTLGTVVPVGQASVQAQFLLTADDRARLGMAIRDAMLPCTHPAS